MLLSSQEKIKVKEAKCYLVIDDGKKLIVEGIKCSKKTCQSESKCW